MGGKDRQKRFPRWFGDRRAFRGLNASLKESLVLVARAGFIPNGNNDRSHRGTTLLALHKAGAGAADVMLKRRGHLIWLALSEMQPACQA
jgi:hypothetical protein